MRKFVPVSIAAVALAGSLAFAAPAQAQPVVTGGLVNVTIANVLNNNTVTVQVPIGAAVNLAANVCGVSVAVLAQDLSDGSATCTNNTSGQTVTVGPVTP